MQGRILAVILFFVVCAAGYALFWLVIPTIIAAIAHLWAIIDAAKFRPYT